MLTKLKTLLLGCSLACIGFSCSNHPVLTNADDVEQPLDSGYITLDLRSNLHLSRKDGTHDPLRSVRRITFLFFHETDSKLLLSRTVEPTSDLSFDLKIPKQNYRLAVLVNSGTSYAAIIPEILLYYLQQPFKLRVRRFWSHSLHMRPVILHPSRNIPLPWPTIRG